MLGFWSWSIAVVEAMNDSRPAHFDLQATARQIMLEHGFEPDFPAGVPQQLAELKAHPPQVAPGADIRDLRQLLWSSIDNDTSRDLDQIEVAERLTYGRDQSTGGNRRRGRLRPQAVADRWTRGEGNDHGLHRHREFPHAARRPQHRRLFPAGKRRQAERSDRVCGHSRMAA